MTASAYFTLYCDANKIGYTTPGTAKSQHGCRFLINTEEIDINSARKSATEQGWREEHQGNQVYDICPDHNPPKTEDRAMSRDKAIELRHLARAAADQLNRSVDDADGKLLAAYDTAQDKFEEYLDEHELT